MFNFLRTLRNYTFLAFVLVFLLILVVNSFRIVGPGEKGLIITWGAVSDKILSEGIHFRFPIMQKVVVLNVKTQKAESEAISYSRDLQSVDTTIALNYHLDPNSIDKLWQELGADYRENIIDPAVQESVKGATAQFTAQELIEQRPKVKDEILLQLKNRLTGKHIVVDDFSIINFDFSDSYEVAIEAKQVSQQGALKAENDLRRIKTEAEQRIAQAQAEAEAIRIQAESISKQGGDAYVRLKTVEQWDGKLPTYMLPNSTVPFVELK
ncbi:MAG: membrane protease subunit, stomatin/prohibitin [Parcubacteria group bacterium Gr01-1014_18]|nr:MAG: membrane protease subunit, stomatin/prohibitin [Parcubacteria group bacterium Greene0416_36]TSC80955.1 MAG: membrane protease subunit, stomatin/prohibitin [Parcubacteria group bacterium Gr01-1014_18]TSC98702.1 MAG: membrane protease subunit, stomatin/prohibitin [Parcubacteria group bacterium Greene1014_20]TSD06454.1 MAG: membrane protease subunit, stomatin/prohibitin [Parcubacteria group bacterium Greene0714_2]